MLVSKRYETYVQLQSKTYDVVPNIKFKYGICEKCGVNLSYIPDSIKTKLLNDCCANCNGVPYLVIGVTSIAGFRSLSCKYAWYLKVVEKKKEKPNFFSIQGSVFAEIEDKFHKMFVKGNMLKNLEALYPSKQKIFDYLMEILRKVADEKISEEIKNGEFVFSDVEVSNIKAKIFDKIKLFALVQTIRAINDIESDGDFFVYQSKIKTEVRLMFPFVHDDVKLLVKGKVDKVYELPNNMVFVRDDKLKRTVKVSHFKNIEQDCSEQLGGYFLGFKYMGKNPVFIGLMWLSLYFEPNPILNDDSGWTLSAIEVCKYIKYSYAMKIPDCKKENSCPVSLWCKN